MHRQAPGTPGAYGAQGSSTPVPGSSRFLTNRIIPDMGSPRLDSGYQSAYGRQGGDYGTPYSPVLSTPTPGTPLVQGRAGGQGTPFPSGSTLYPSSSLLLGSSSSLHATPSERGRNQKRGDGGGAQALQPPMRSIYDDMGEPEVRNRRTPAVAAGQQPTTPSWGGYGGRRRLTPFGGGGQAGERWESERQSTATAVSNRVEPMDEEMVDTEEEARMRRTVATNAGAVSGKRHEDMVALHLEGEVHDERCVIVFGFPPNDYEGVQRLLGKPGDFLSIKTGQGGNWMYIRFRTAMLADQARARNGSWYAARQCVLGVLRCRDGHHTDAAPLGEAQHGGQRQHAFKPYSGDYGVEEVSTTRGAVPQRSFTSKVAEYLFGL